MDITPFFEPISCTFSYLLCDPQGRKAAIIDPVMVYDTASGQASTEFAAEMLQAAENAGCELQWILETHAHADHITAARWLKDRSSALVCIGAGIVQVQKTFHRVYNLDGSVATNGSQFDRLLRQGDAIQLGQETIQVLETPGHTSDSLTYISRNGAFIGDTLFRPQIGTARCDFPGGDAGLLYDSIQKIYALGDTTRLYLCHDYPPPGEEPIHCFTVADAKRDNGQLDGHTSKADYIAKREARDAQLGMPAQILPALQINIQAGKLPPPEDNGVRYLKIPFHLDIAALLR